MALPAGRIESDLGPKEGHDVTMDGRDDERELRCTASEEIAHAFTRAPSGGTVEDGSELINRQHALAGCRRSHDGKSTLGEVLLASRKVVVRARTDERGHAKALVQ